MKKRVIVFFVFIFLLLIIPFNVSAVEPTTEDNSATCSKVYDTIDEYEAVQTDLDGLNCETTTDTTEISKCNQNITKRSYILSKLFKMNDDYPECRTNRLQTVINDNSEACHSVLDSSIKDLSHNILVAFYIIAPFLLIIFGSVDFAKIVVSTGDPKEIVKLKNNFVKRVVATIMVYMLPFFMNFVISLNITGASLEGNVYTCDRNLHYSMDHWETVYVPNANKSSGSSYLGVNSQGAQAILDAAAQIHNKYVDEKWTYSTAGLSYGNIKRSLELTDRVTCCATYVGQVFYIAGIFTEEEVNGYGYNSAPSTYLFLKGKNWIRIDNYDDLQPGDIVFEDMQPHGKPGHVQIYYGDGKWYNAGSTNAINDGDGRTSPYASNDRSIFVCAYRMP